MSVLLSINLCGLFIKKLTPLRRTIIWSSGDPYNFVEITRKKQSHSPPHATSELPCRTSATHLLRQIRSLKTQNQFHIFHFLQSSWNCKSLFVDIYRALHGREKPNSIESLPCRDLPDLVLDLADRGVSFPFSILFLCSLFFRARSQFLNSFLSGTWKSRLL